MYTIVKRAILSACVAATVGCGQPAVAPRVFDMTFAFQGPRQDVQYALAAAADWNKCGVVTVAIAAPGYGLPINWSPGPFDDHKTEAVGLFIPDDPQILYRSDVGSVQKIITHEIGHAMGLGHSDNPKDIMYYKLGDNSLVTAGDCKALRDL